MTPPRSPLTPGRRPARTPRLLVESLDSRQLLSGLGALVSEAGAKLGLVPTERASPHGREIANIPYTHHGAHAVQLDLYLPAGAPPPGGWPVILAFPGGGWRQADRKDYGGAVSVFTKFGYAVEGVDYTYAGKTGGHSWPTNFEDARAAVRWTRQHAGHYGLNPDKLVAMGESAGAHLALLLGTYPEGPVSLEQPASGGGAPVGGVSSRVQAVVDFYGATDLAALYSGSRAEVLPYLKTFLGGSPSQYPGRYADASPLTYVSSDTPPVLIVQGLADRTVLPSQSLALDAALTQAGVPHRLMTFPTITHGFRFALGSYSLIPDVLAFLHGALNGGSLS